MLQKHPRQMSWRHFVPPAFVAALGGLTALGIVVPAGGAAPRARSSASTLLAVLAVAASRRLRRGVGAWLATALAFVSIHLAWGAGFLNGLITFAGRWRAPETAPPRLESRGGDTPAPAARVAAAAEVIGRTP